MNFLQEKLIKPLAQSIVAWSGFSSFGGANYTSSRSFAPYFPLDARREVDTWTRVELLRKFRWLRNNVGLVRRLVNGTARYSVGGGIIPRSTTTDETWNKLSDAWFDNWASNKKVCDIEGRHNFWAMQRQCARGVVGDGEMFTQLIGNMEGTHPDDTVLGTPQLQNYESHEIADSSSKPDDTVDGLVLNKYNKATAYRVIVDQSGNYVDIPAEAMVHAYDPERIGQLRGITWLYHGVNSLIDIMDLGALEKQSVKVHSMLAVAVKNKAGEAGGTGLTGTLQTLVTKAQKQANPTLQQATLEKAFGGGMIPWLNSDEELQLLTSNRPSPTFTGFLDWLVRDIAWGFGTSPEFVWSLAGMGGANTRMILEDAQWFFQEVQQIVIESWSAPIRTWVLAKAMKMNERDSALGIPRCKDPQWWNCTWQVPPRITVDQGRDGQLEIDRLLVGFNTIEDYWSARGHDGREKIVARIREVKFAQEQCAKEGVRYEDVFPPQAGAAAKTKAESAPGGGAGAAGLAA